VSEEEERRGAKSKRAGRRGDYSGGMMGTMERGHSSEAQHTRGGQGTKATSSALARWRVSPERQRSTYPATPECPTRGAVRQPPSWAISSRPTSRRFRFHCTRGPAASWRRHRSCRRCRRYRRWPRWPPGRPWRREPGCGVHEGWTLPRVAYWLASDISLYTNRHLFYWFFVFFRRTKKICLLHSCTGACEGLPRDNAPEARSSCVNRLFGIRDGHIRTPS
jgi:hypothetical protein